MKQYFYLDSKNTQVGPFSAEQIKEFIQKFTLRADTFIWVEGQEHWKKLEEYPEFSEDFQKLKDQKVGGCMGCLIFFVVFFFICLIAGQCTSTKKSSSDPMPTFSGDSQEKATDEDIRKAAEWLLEQDRKRGN